MSYPRAAGLVVLIAPTLALLSAPAHAALDDLCGTVLTESIVLDHDVDCTGYTGNAITIGQSGVTLDGAGFRLLAPDASRAITMSGVSNVTIRDLAVEGWCTGHGVYIDGGSAITLDNVQASGRSVGVYAQNTAGLSISDLAANSCSAQGLSLKNTTDLTLAGLVLDNNATGLRLDTISGPLTLGPTQITSIAGNDVSIELFASVSGVTIEGLALDGRTFGVQASATTISDLTLRDLDLSQTAGVGTGLTLRGPNHTLQRIIANRRATGVYANLVSDLAIDDLTANGNLTAGLTLLNVTGTLSLNQLTLEDNLTAFSLTTYTAPTRLSLTTYDPLTEQGTFVSLAKSDTGLLLSNVQNLRVHDLALDNLTAAIEASASNNADIVFEDLDLSAPRTNGYGLYLRGRDHVVRRIVANRRGFGLRVLDADALVLTDITATGCSVGVRLEALPATFTPPTLARLLLTDNLTGFTLAGVATPLTFSPATALDVGRSVTGINIIASPGPVVTSRNLVFEDLVFDNPEYGIDAPTVTHADFTFRRVSFPGPGRGFGLVLSGSGHTLDTVAATGRATCFQLTTTSDVTVSNLDASHCGNGLWLESLNPTHVAPTVSGLTLRNNNNALYLNLVTLPITIDESWGLDVTDSSTGINLNQSTDLTFTNLVLRSQGYGAYTSGTATARLTFDTIDARAPGPAGHVNTHRGYGLSLVGPEHVLRQITAHGRKIGVNASSAKGLQVDGLYADNCSEAGLAVSGIAAADAAPQLHDIQLRDGVLGLSLSGVHSPLTLDETTLLDVSGAATGLYVYGSSDLTVRNVPFSRNRVYAIHAQSANTRLTFEDLDVSGEGYGHGIRMGYLGSNNQSHYGGLDHQITRVTANRRSIGFEAIAASNLRVADFTSNHSGIGLRLEGTGPFNGVPPPPFTMPTLIDLDLADNALAFVLSTHKPATPWTLGPFDPLTGSGAITSLAGSEVGLQIQVCDNLVVEDLVIPHAASAAFHYGIIVLSSSNLTFRDLVIGSSGAGIRVPPGSSALTFEDLDLSGDGTGYGLYLGTNTSSPGNYGGPDHVIRNIVTDWRSYGMLAYGTTNLTVDGLTARHNSTYGLFVQGYAGMSAPDLTRLTLEDNLTGLGLYAIEGTALAPYDLGPARFTSLTRNATSIYLPLASHVLVHDLTLDGTTAGLDGGGSNVTVRDIVSHGVGYGVGVKLTGANHLVERVTASLRDNGVFMTSTTNPTLRDLAISRTRQAGVQLTTTTHPITLASLSLDDCRTGLGMSTVNGTGSLTIDASTLGSHARTQTSVSLSGAASVTVDTAALGLTQTGGTYSTPVPPSDPICGTTITTDLILTADLDCSGITSPTNAITIGADGLTIDGGPSRFKIIAPRAAAVIRSINRNAVTVRNLDLSGTWALGDALSIDGGSGHLVDDVVASTRDRGVYLVRASDSTVTELTTRGNYSSGLTLDTATFPITLNQLSLTDGQSAGLYITGYDGLDPVSGDKQVFDASALTTLTGNATSIALGSNVKNLAFVGPIAGLDGTTAAISGNASTNTGLVLTGLTLDAARTVGTGLLIGGSDHLVSDCTVTRRAIGFDLNNGTGLVLASLTADRIAGDALSLDNAVPALMKDLSLTRSVTGLDLRNLSGGGFVIRPYDDTLDAGAISDLSGNQVGVRLVSSADLRFEELTSDAWSTAISVSGAGSADIELVDLVLARTRPQSHNGSYAATPASVGLSLTGADHLVSGLTIRGHATGLTAGTTSNLTVEHLDVDTAPAKALALTTVTLPLMLTDLSLTNAAIGLDINGLGASEDERFFIGPFDGESGAITSVAGTINAIALTNVRFATIHDLVLPNDYAINANVASNADLILERLTLDHAYGGNGAILQGARHLVRDVSADFRATGISLYGDAHRLERVSVRYATGNGLLLSTASTPPTLSQVTLGGSNVCLQLSAIAGTAVTPLVIDRWHALNPTGAIVGIDRCYDSIGASNVQHARIRDLTLDGSNNALTAYTTSNRDFTLADIDVSPSRYGGNGANLAGANHTLTDLTSRYRAFGVQVGQASALRIERLDAQRNTSGLILQNVPDLPATYLPPTLSGLDLRDNSVGLYFDGWALPLTLDPAIGLDVRRSKVGIQFHRSVASWSFSANVTVRGLSDFQTPSYSTNFGAPTISAHPILVLSASSDLVFEDLDLSGAGLGSGIYLSAPTDVTLRNVTANDRAIGVFISNPTRGLIEDLEVRRSTAGLMLWSGTANNTAPTFDGLTLTDNGEALYLWKWSTPMTIDATTGLDVARSAYGISAYDTANVTFADLVLDNPVRGLRAMDLSGTPVTTNLALRNLNLSGSGRGYGLELKGAGHVLEDLVADDREYGVAFTNPDSAVITRVFAANAAEAALYLLSLPVTAGAPTLSDLRLTNSKYGLRVATFQLPFTFDATMLTDLAGNHTPLYFSSTNFDQTVRGLTLPSPNIGVWLEHQSNARLTLEDVDVTGHCRGTGLSVAGSDITVTGLTAARRATGIYQNTGDRLTISDSVIGANTIGVQVTGSSLIVDTAVTADATNSTTRFRVGALTNMTIGQALNIDLDGGAVERTVSALSGFYLTVSPALPSIPPVGTTVRALNYGEPRIALTSSDVCANGTGYTAGSHITFASDNYWRSDSGPRHASIPAGTGDLVTATQTTLEPFVPVPTDKENPYCNQAPIAEAGPPQTACEGDLVTLDGSLSYDPDIEPLLYLWTQLAGPSATIDDPALALATFVAPAPPPGVNVATLDFELMVDDRDIQRTDTTEVTINRRNPAPTAVASADQALDEGAPVTLSSAGSFDPEGTALTYLWTQTAGPSATLGDPTAAELSFTAPLLDVGGAPHTAELVFSLAVTDEALPDYCGGASTAFDEVRVTVANVNHAPTADAGDDASVFELATVTLDASLSSDPDDDPLSFTWLQIEGPTVTLDDPGAASPSFTAPDLPCRGSATLRFRLAVADGFGGEDSAEVRIDVGTVDADSDGDGFADCEDECPADPDKIAPGVCGCGVDDDDGDGDQVADCFDQCPNDPDKSEPGVCGCGSPDSDSDGDERLDCLDGCPLDPAKITPGVCGCGVPDLDSDGDQTLDCAEDCDADPDKTAPGLCGCGIADDDRDLDGTPDCDDACADDPAKVDPGQCGCGHTDYDLDDDGVAECENICAELTAEDCAGAPFHLTVKTPTGPGQITCRFIGETLDCDHLDGVAVVTPVVARTRCE